MRARTVAGFVIGFAFGALLIGGGLWGTGKLQTAHMPPWIHPEAPVAPAVTLPQQVETAPGGEAAAIAGDDPRRAMLQALLDELKTLRSALAQVA